MRELSDLLAHGSRLVITYEARPGADVVSLGGVLDLNTSAHARECILGDPALDAPVLVLDLHRLELVDSSGIGAIVVLNRTLRERGRRVALVTASAHFRKLFKISGVDQVVAIHSTLGQALARSVDPAGPEDPDGPDGPDGPDDTEPASAS